jgi:hypothetical protein
MYGDGWIIGNHSKSHTNLTGLSLADQMLALLGARDALIAHGMTNVDYVAYPFGAYNADTLTAMSNLGMRNGRTILEFNNVAPLVRPFEIAQRAVGQVTSLATVKGWVDTAKARQEILVLTFHDIGISPTSNGWYIDRFQSVVTYCMQQSIPILTMDDLYRVQSNPILIPLANLNPIAYTLDVSKVGTGSGTVTSNPAGINCGPDCSEDYGYYTFVTLSAPVGTGPAFTGWSGSGCSGTGTCQVTMDTAKSVTATFSVNTQRISLPLVIR